MLKAFDEKLERIVAMKVMAPELAATSPARKRFLREARATAAIRHENVVSIYAVEEQPLPFLVMEYIDGETLQQRIDRTGPLNLLDVLRIAQRIAQGLAAAHDKGLIHRDIKPGKLVRRELVTVTRNGRQVVRVSRENAPKQVAREWDNRWPAETPPPAVAPFGADQAKRLQQEWAHALGLPVVPRLVRGRLLRDVTGGRPGRPRVGSGPRGSRRVRHVPRELLPLRLASSRGRVLEDGIPSKRDPTTRRLFPCARFPRCFC